MKDPTTGIFDETVAAFLRAVPGAADAYRAALSALAVRFPAGDTEAVHKLRAYLCRKAQIWDYLGKTVSIGIDRPIGYVHRKGTKTLVLPINYGFVPGVFGGDGEELDVYVADSTTPSTACTVRLIGAVHRANDVEDKLIGTLSGTEPDAETLAHTVAFAEKYYETRIQTLAARDTLFWDWDIFTKN